jgi:hypothetical protein
VSTLSRSNRHARTPTGKPSIKGAYGAGAL